MGEVPEAKPRISAEQRKEKVFPGCDFEDANALDFWSVDGGEATIVEGFDPDDGQVLELRLEAHGEAKYTPPEPVEMNPGADVQVLWYVPPQPHQFKIKITAVTSTSITTEELVDFTGAWGAYIPLPYTGNTNTVRELKIKTDHAAVIRIKTIRRR